MADRGAPETQLQFQLDAITNHTRALVPPDRLRLTEELVEALHASGQQERLLGVGASAMSFALRDASGRQVRSEDLLALGPLVLKFFRGRWDPYDITELEALQTTHNAIRMRGAVLIGISPQTMRQNAFTAEQHHLSFPLLSDPRCEVAEKFGVAYTVPGFAQAHYRSMLVNIPFINGDESWRLPLPASFVLGRDGRVEYAETYADHRRRPDPACVVAALESIQRGR